MSSQELLNGCGHALDKPKVWWLPATSGCQAFVTMIKV